MTSLGAPSVRTLIGNFIRPRAVCRDASGWRLAGPVESTRSRTATSPRSVLATSSPCLPALESSLIRAPSWRRRRRRAQALQPTRRLVEDQALDRQPGGGAVQRQSGARGVAVDGGRATGLRDQRAQVLDLALDGIGRGVGALAPATAVVVDHAEPLRQLLGERLGRRPGAEDAADQDHRRPFAEAIEGDPGSVVGDREVGHVSSTGRGAGTNRCGCARARCDRGPRRARPGPRPSGSGHRGSRSVRCRAARAP